MAKKYNCPKCGCEVEMANINVANDILLCSSCGETSRFSEIVDLEREAKEEDYDAQLLNTNNSNTVRVCAGMSDDALDYVAAVIRREASKV